MDGTFRGLLLVPSHTAANRRFAIAAMLFLHLLTDGTSTPPSAALFWWWQLIRLASTPDGWVAQVDTPPMGILRRGQRVIQLWHSSLSPRDAATDGCPHRRIKGSHLLGVPHAVIVPRQLAPTCVHGASDATSR